MEDGQKGQFGFKDKFNLGTVLIFLGAVLAVVGSFMAWATVLALSFSGISGDGKLTAMVGGVLILLLVFVYSGGKVAKIVTITAAVAAGLLVIFVAVYDGTNIGRAGSNFLSASAGTGIYVVAIGGFLAIIGAVCLAVGISADNFYRLGDLPRKQQIGAALIVVMALGTTSGAYFAAKGNSSPDSSAVTNSPSPATYNRTADPQTNEKPQLHVLSSNFQKDELGYAHIMGEIKNTGNVDAYNADVTVTLTAKGQVVATGHATNEVRLMKKDQIAPYSVQIDNPPAYDNMNVEVTAESRTYQNYRFADVVSQNPRSGTFSELSVAGEIQNNTSADINDIDVVVWLLDQSGKVIDIENTYVNGRVAAKAKQPYEVHFIGKNDDSYKTIKVVAIGTGTGDSTNAAPGNQTTSTPASQGSYETEDSAVSYVQSLTPFAGATMVAIDPNSTWRPEATLHVIHANPKSETNIAGDYYYFFVEGNLVGEKDFSAGKPDASINDPTAFAITFTAYNPGDPHCCPSGGNSNVKFQWDGSQLNTLGSMQGATFSVN